MEQPSQNSVVSCVLQVEAEQLLYHTIWTNTRSQKPSSGGPDCASLLSMAQVWCHIQAYNVGPAVYSSEMSCDRMQVLVLLSLLFSKLTELVVLNPMSSYEHTDEVAHWRSCGNLFKDCSFCLLSLSCPFILNSDLGSLLEMHPGIVDISLHPPTQLSYYLSSNALPHLNTLCFQGQFIHLSVIEMALQCTRRDQ
jgi:hypothetical protein